MGYFSGQGRIYIAERSLVTPGEPDVYRWVGNSPEFTLSFETEVEEHKESWTGQRAVDLRLLQEKRATVSMILEDFDKKNLALALFGEDSDVAGGSVTAESLAGGATTIAVGDFLSLRGFNVSSVVINDDAAGTLVEGTDYNVYSAEHGTIEIIGDLSGYTLPLTADYTEGASQNINMLTQPLSEKYVKFDGINTAAGGLLGDKVVAELYRVAFDPTEALEFIGDEVAGFTLNGSSLIDEDKQGDPLLGLFGRVAIL